MKRIVVLALAFIAITALALPGSILAAEYPSKPITYSIPFNPGGQSDLEARRQQPLLEKILDTKIVIQYKPGGGGSLGWSDLVQQRPDGYFVSAINIPHIILQPMARGDAGYTTEQIEPVAFFQATPIGLAVMKESPFQTLEDLVAHAQKNPGAVILTGSGTWSGHHVAHLEFQDLIDTQMTYIPQTGAAPAVAALLGGHAQGMWGNSNDLVQHADKVRVLAFATKEPFFAMPEVPTFMAKGYDLLASIDRGLGVPPGTPADRIAILEKAFLEIANNPEIIETMKKEGYVPLAMNAAESKAYIQEMMQEWAPIVEKYNK